MSFCYRSTLIPIHSPVASVRKRRAMTLHPIKVKPQKREAKTIDQIKEEIINNHEAINEIIYRFKEVISQRLQSQEIELLSIFKHTMDNMMTQIDEIVTNYKKVIQQVKVQPTINKLQNELSYFKTEALQLFEINKQNKQQILTLKKTIFDLKIDEQTNKKTIQKLIKRFNKQKARNNSLLTDHSQCQALPFMTQDSDVKSSYMKTERKKTISQSIKKLF